MVTYSPMLDLLSRTAAQLYGTQRLADHLIDDEIVYTRLRAVVDAADLIRLADEHLKAAHVLRLDPPTEGMAVIGCMDPENT